MGLSLELGLTWTGCGTSRVWPIRRGSHLVLGSELAGPGGGQWRWKLLNNLNRCSLRGHKMSLRLSLQENGLRLEAEEYLGQALGQCERKRKSLGSLLALQALGIQWELPRVIVASFRKLWWGRAQEDSLSQRYNTILINGGADFT